MSPEAHDFRPLSLTRSIGDLPIANIALARHQHQAMGSAALTVNPQAWLDPDDLADFLTSGQVTLVDGHGTALLWQGAAPDSGSVFPAKGSFLIRYPWDLLRANEQALAALTGNAITGEVHPSAVIEGVLHLGQGSRILPGVFIEGKVVIGAHCKIGPNCYIRGSTSIGDACHIGQSVEIKNSIILAKSQVGHLSYVGDSVLGEAVNFGAGTITSNYRHDGTHHRSMVDGVLVDTGRRKLGAIVGDRVHTGIHTSIYPGRKLWPGTSTSPGEIVQRDLED
jgi:bifunctional UDP-N-acetylglucosamine pyrophosphorylase/glucosamine-1-phosphate N-acetyltransferase